MRTLLLLPRTRAALIACLALLLPVLLVPVLLVPAPSALGRTAGPPTQTTEALPVQVLVDAVRPAVIGPGTPWRVSGTVRNLGRDPVPVDAVRVSTAYRGLDSRTQIAAWAAGDTGSSTTRVVGEDALAGELAPGASAAFVVEVDGAEVAPPFGFATLPLTVEVVSAEATRGRLRTVLPWYAQEPASPTLSLSWVVPLTVPPGTDLGHPELEVRTQARVDAIGPGSTVRTWLDALADHDATFVVDPALLVPVLPGGELAAPEPTPESPAEPAPQDGQEDGQDGPPAATSPAPTATATAPPLPSPAPTSAPPSAPGSAPGATAAPGDQEGPAPTTAPGGAGTGQGEDDGATQGPSLPLPAPSATAPDGEGEEVPEDELTALEQAELELQDALTGLGTDRLWWTPLNDPDLAALIDLQVSTSLAERALTAALPEDALLARPLLELGRHDVAWPVWDAVEAVDLRDLVDLWPEDAEAPTAVVVPGAAVDVSGPDLVGTVPVAPEGELPGDELTLLGFDPVVSGLLAGVPGPAADGATIQRMVAETLAVHQELGPLVPRSLVIASPRGGTVDEQTLADLVAAFDAAPWVVTTPAADLLRGAPGATLTGAAPGPVASGDPTAFPQALPSPLTSERVIALETTRERVGEVSAILPSSEAATRWVSVLDALYSTRWRLGAGAWTTPLQDLDDQIDTVLAGVQVNPTQVNFLADEGTIQMTVVNTLPVTVADLTLHVEPGNGRLRVVEQPETITIGPDSRATVVFRARAVASGQVPVRAYLSTPSGLVVGEEQLLQVRVQPTGTWIYWVLGGTAGVILVLGIARATRATPTRAAQAAAHHPGDKDSV